MTSLLWQPSAEALENSAMAKLANQLGPFNDYAEFHEWSITHLEEFWSAVWDSTGIVGSKGDKPYLSSHSEIFKARFFPQGRLNYAENLLQANDDALAIIALWEDGREQQLSYGQLREQVASASEFLRQQGVGEGDVVAGFVPHGITAVVGLLATAALGAVWTSCSPDFGVAGLVDRFGQVAPKALFTINAYHYNTKLVPMKSKVDEIVAALPSLKAVVVEDYVSCEDDFSDYYSMSQVVSTANTGLRYVQVGFNDPLFVLYSSGTTGKPKCIQHSVGGALIQHRKEHALHGDMKMGDRLMYFTTCGWMMWNWQVSALAGGTTLVCYDGSPFVGGPNKMWELSERYEVTHFGTSAKYLAAIEKGGYHPREHYHLKPLRVLFSTGSPLAPEGFDFVYQHVKADVCLASIIGGTDLLGCFAGGNPITPVFKGEIQCLALGMATNVWDDEGQALIAQKGELVCTQPFPSMPLCFVGDEGDKKYHSAYFEHFENIWSHGDYAEITEQGGLIIFGRSDALLNPGGVRIGTAEIYREVESFSEIEESICIGQQWEDDTRVVLFVRMKAGYELDESLKQAMAKRIREQNTPRHVPAKIIAVDDIPRTLSGKITEVAVRQVVHGETVKNTDALANPESLALFKDLPELQR